MYALLFFSTLHWLSFMETFGYITINIYMSYNNKTNRCCTWYFAKYQNEQVWTVATPKKFQRILLTIVMRYNCVLVFQHAISLSNATTNLSYYTIGKLNKNQLTWQASTRRALQRTLFFCVPSYNTNKSCICVASKKAY